MDQAAFSQNVMGLVSSITTPLLSSLILIDGLINEDIDSVEDYGNILLIDEQIQSSIEYFFELRTLTLNKIGSELINKKSRDRNNEIKIGEKYTNPNHFIINNLENELINEINNDNTNKKWWKELSSGILIVLNIGILIWQMYKMMPI
jgi:hypothetical protein